MSETGIDWEAAKRGAYEDITPLPESAKFLARGTAPRALFLLCRAANKLTAGRPFELSQAKATELLAVPPTQAWRAIKDLAARGLLVFVGRSNRPGKPNLWAYSEAGTVGTAKTPSAYWEAILARSEAVMTPRKAEGLPGDLKRLARICVVLSDDSDHGVFPLGSGKAAELVGAHGYPIGAAALRALVEAEVLEIVSKGTPTTGVSTWRMASASMRSLPAYLVDAMHGGRMACASNN